MFLDCKRNTVFTVWIWRSRPGRDETGHYYSNDLWYLLLYSWLVLLSSHHGIHYHKHTYCKRAASSDWWMDELGFYVPSTVFQSFPDDGRVYMKGCAMKRRLGSGRISLSAGFEPATPWSEVRSANRSATRMLRVKRIGTYRLCEQHRFRRACAFAQSRQNLRCSLIQAVSRGTFRQKAGSLAPLNGWECAVNSWRNARRQIRLTRPK